MRRFASVFAPRREKNDSSPPQPSASSPSLPASKKNVRRVDISNSPVVSSSPSSPHFGRGSDVGQSSSSSSGSASLQTPDDIPISLDHAPAKSKSWINSWLSKKPSVTKVKHTETQDSNREWLPSHPPPLLRPPPPGIRTAPPVQDSDLDTSDSDDDDDDSLSAAPVHGRSIPSSAVPISRKYLSARLQNALVSRPSASPFVLSPPSRNSQNLSYPRSTNRGPLSRQETLHSLMLKKHLLNRLLDPADPLSFSEQASILPFSMKNPPSLLPPFASSIDEIALPKSAKVVEHSPGLRRWIDRPCFEHRFAVWLAADDGITRQMVTGTRFAVPDLEFSEAIEVMVDFSEQPQPEALAKASPPASETPATDVPLSPSSSFSHGSVSQRPSVQPTAPSPLRKEADSPNASQMLPPSPPPSPPQTAVKRGVRFAEDDKEDQIPIGYIMRVKKQREAKAKFLRQQKEQRQFAEEQARIDKERQEREEQRLQWEKERKAWEKEKRAMDEERNKRLYAEEIAAARVRRETQKMGSSSKAISSSSSIASLRSNANKESQQSSKYSRVAYDPIAPPPRRQGSEVQAGAANSRPSSLTGHSNYPSQAGSRPSSVYSSSSDDVTKRHSAASTSNVHGRWSSSNTSLVAPSPSFLPPPPMPFLSSPPSSFDLPLLPPTAPFMLHQYPRPRSHHSSSSPSQSPSQSPARNSMNRSTDHVNRASTFDSFSNRSSSSSPHRPMGHHRRTSDDAQPVCSSPRGRAIEPASASVARMQASSMSSRSSANMTRMPPSYSGTVPSRRATAIS